MLIIELIVKAVAFVVFFLLDLVGWRRAGEWLAKMIGEDDKDERPVV